MAATEPLKAAQTSIDTQGTFDLGLEPIPEPEPKPTTEKLTVQAEASRPMLSIEEARAMLEATLAAEEAELGPNFEKKYKGRFWLDHDTRPYMMSLEMLASFERAIGNNKAAIVICEKMLKMNFTDNQGMRYELIGLLLAERRLPKAQKLLETYQKDESAWFMWARVLYHFTMGDRQTASRILKRARRLNPFVELYLTGKAPMPEELPEFYIDGEESEAILAVNSLAEAWARRQNAQLWLRAPANRRHRLYPACRKNDRPSVSSPNFEIVLCDVDGEVCSAFLRAFRHPQVSVEHGDFFDVYADAYVSPANSHGIMDGGFDRLLRNRFPGIEARVQQGIDERGGLLPVGAAIIVETDDADVLYVICAPTMVSPMSIAGTRNVHAAMSAILRVVREFNLENDDPIGSIAIPGLGTGIGRMAPEAAASQMRDAFDEFLASI